MTNEWTCQACGSVNLSTNVFCTRCGGARQPEPVEPSSQPEHGECSNSLIVNYANAGYRVAYARKGIVQFVRQKPGLNVLAAICMWAGIPLAGIITAASLQFGIITIAGVLWTISFGIADLLMQREKIITVYLDDAGNLKRIER